MTTFQIYLNDDGETVRVRAFCDGDAIADLQVANWDSAFDECIHALKNGQAKARDEEVQE
ncbi:MAG: hypothetical protein CML99_13180 [Rhodobiaceae bacterium]|nr:hypothetical protein [Rhodobiaceae bacterium]|tara:strand:+ start:18 stop:197 length:180 start_codon:yes stop_codon:yes gene_type:complete